MLTTITASKKGKCLKNWHIHWALTANSGSTHYFCRVDDIEAFKSKKRQQCLLFTILAEGDSTKCQGINCFYQIICWSIRTNVFYEFLPALKQWGKATPIIDSWRVTISVILIFFNKILVGSMDLWEDQSNCISKGIRRSQFLECQGTC